MSKKIEHQNINDTLEIELEDISLEELDLSMDKFYIDEEKINSIKAPRDMKLWVKDAIDKAEYDIKKSKRKKQIIASVASITVIFSIGVYNPVLAHRISFLENLLQNINDTLKIDEISYRLGIDKILPKVTIDKENKVKYIKPPKYKINKKEINKDDVIFLESSEFETSEGPKSEYSSVQFIHKMSNSIINPIDGRKYGNIEISPKTIDLAIKGLKYINNEDIQNYLNFELEKWKNGDFNNAVEVHNYVWDLLDGQVGKAISINESSVENVLKKYFK